MNTENQNTNIENQTNSTNAESQSTPVVPTEPQNTIPQAPATPQQPVEQTVPVASPIVNPTNPNPNMGGEQNTSQNQNTGSNQGTGTDNQGDKTSTFSKEDIENGKVLSVLSYIGFLVLIPFFTEKNNSYVIFHAKQGMNLFIIDIIAGTVLSLGTVFIGGIGTASGIVVFTILSGLMSTAISAAMTIFMILGIVNAASGQAKELPIISKFKIIK